MTTRLLILVIGFVVPLNLRFTLRPDEYGSILLQSPGKEEENSSLALRGATTTAATSTSIPATTTTTTATSAATSVSDNKTTNTPTYQKNFPWDGIPQEEVGHPLVKKGFVDFIDNSRSLFLDGPNNLLDEFLTVYEGRPDKVNLCGMRINHSYSLFLAVKALKPTAIIESGVNAGHSTYIMRAAAGPDTKLYPMDPLEKPICNQQERWMDPTSNNEYFTGTNFKDFNEVDWAAKIKSGEIDPERTLVLLDDHLDPSTRYPTLVKMGFRHILLEDNYKANKGATQGDKAGWLPKQLFSRNDRDSQFFFQITKRYAEFPPLVPPILAKEYKKPSKPAGGFLHVTDDLKTLVAPLLRPDLDEDDRAIYEKICKSVGINPALTDDDSYMQVMNYNQFAYIELVPMAPRLMQFLNG